MKGTTNSAKIFLESGTGKVCRPPPPRRLEMAIMLSTESMIAMVPGSKKSPGHQKAAGRSKFYTTASAPEMAVPGSNALRI